MIQKNHASKNILTTVLRFGANSQASAPRSTRGVDVYQEGASEQFRVKAIGVTEVPKDDSNKHLRVSVLPECFGEEITSCSLQRNWYVR